MHFEELLFAAVLILGIVAVSVAIFKRLAMGAILGFLAAGVVVGPSGFAVTDRVEELRHLTELGVVLLLFIIGLEMQPKKLWSMRRKVFGLGSCQVLVTGVVLTGYMFFLTEFEDWKTALVLGFGLALSSTAFVIQMLGDRGDFNTEHGQATFSILLLQDIAIVPLLTAVTFLSGGPDAPSPGWQEALLRLGAIALVLAAGRYLIPFGLGWAAKNRNMEAFSAIAMFAALGAAWVMEESGLSMALGAFLVGMMLSGSEYRHQVEAKVEPFKGVMLGLFFIAVGMSVDLALFFENPFAIIRNLIILIVIKVAIIFGLCLLFRVRKGAAVRTAFMLGQAGEFGFVLFGAAQVLGLLPDLAYVLALLVVSISMAVTPLLAKLGDRLAERFEASDGELPATSEVVAMERHVIIAGYGRVGMILCRILARAEIPYVAFDSDPKRCEEGKAIGHNVHFGDLTDPEGLKTAGIGDAGAVVITLADFHGLEKVASTVATFYPAVPRHALAHHLEDQDKVLALGVRTATPEVAEGSLHLGREVLLESGVSEEVADDLVESLRRDNYALLRS